MRRYESRSTIMTSNRPLEQWGKLLGDVPTAGAILDRFLHHAETPAIRSLPRTIQGRSYRLKEVPVAGGKRENKRPGGGEKPAGEMVAGFGEKGVKSSRSGAPNLTEATA